MTHIRVHQSTKAPTRALRRDRLHEHEAVPRLAKHVRERAGGGLGPAHARKHGEGQLALYGVVSCYRRAVRGNVCAFALSGQTPSIDGQIRVRTLLRNIQSFSSINTRWASYCRVMLCCGWVGSIILPRLIDQFHLSRESQHTIF